MGEWSPVCKACWWDEGDSARVGGWFAVENELGDVVARDGFVFCDVIAKN